jgi:hypothetical protein
MKKKIYLLTSLFSFLSISLAHAQTYNEYGLRRPMSDRELGIYNQCQGTVRTWMWPEPVNGIQMTFHEALGPDIVMRLCACTAIRSTGRNMCPSSNDLRPIGVLATGVSGPLACCRFGGHEDKIVTYEPESGYDETEGQPRVQD